METFLAPRYLLVQEGKACKPCFSHRNVFVEENEDLERGIVFGNREEEGQQHLSGHICARAGGGNASVHSTGPTGPRATAPGSGHSG